MADEGKKFCKHCGEQIDIDCVVCPKCGKQVEELKSSSPDQSQIVINNNNSASAAASAVATNNVAAVPLRPRNKWVAFCLCFFLGWVGAHKFYEGKVGLGILYIFTCGLLGIGILVDLITILLKPNPYYV